MSVKANLETENKAIKTIKREAQTDSELNSTERKDERWFPVLIFNSMYYVK